MTDVTPAHRAELENLKWRRWDQAWSQSRHLETMRSQYLGFFFTVFLGLTAFSATQLGSDSLGTSFDLVVFAAILLGLDVLSGFLLLAVARIGDVLRYYTSVIVAIEESSVGSATRHDLGWLASIPLSEKTTLRRRLRSTQGVAESVLEGAVGLLPLGLIALAVRGLTVHDVSVFARFSCLVAALAACVLSLTCLGAMRERRLPPARG